MILGHIINNIWIQVVWCRHYFFKLQCTKHKVWEKFALVNEHGYMINRRYLCTCVAIEILNSGNGFGTIMYQENYIVQMYYDYVRNYIYLVARLLINFPSLEKLSYFIHMQFICQRKKGMKSNRAAIEIYVKRSIQLV